jgi:predicted TPR repeat methyltransferase
MNSTTSPSSSTRVAALLMKHPPGAADPGERAEELARAVGLLRDESLDEADTAFAAFLRRHPRDAEGLHYQGILRHTQGRVDEALELLRESLALAPQHAGHWNNYGNVLLKHEHLEAAAEAYRMSVKLATTPADAAQPLNNLSTLSRRFDDLPQAEAFARRATEAMPEWGDAWYNLSVALVAQGRIAEGLQANSKAITLWPRHLQGRQEVIRALILLERRDEAMQLYREWLAEEPDNAIVRHQMAACSGEHGDTAPARASDDYVEQVFDSFAASFDDKLGKLGYQAPQLIAQALADHLGDAPAVPVLDVVDLGCGTGLAGPLLRPWAKRLAGCDLSVGMLQQAQRRGIYDVLHKAELVYYLRTQPAAFDIVVSADTLCYFGPLDDAMQAAAQALRAGGTLAFTVEALPDDGGGAGDARAHALLPQGRYAHARAYVADALAGAGMHVVRIDTVKLRMEAGRAVMGWLVVAVR